MTREVALRDLLADSAHRRLTAARVLARDIKPSDLPPLRQALQSESVVYVRTALNLAIKRASESASTAEPVDQHEYDIPPDVIARLRSEVSEEIAAPHSSRDRVVRRANCVRGSPRDSALLRLHHPTSRGNP